jgi:hypothetical protein
MTNVITTPQYLALSTLLAQGGRYNTSSGRIFRKGEQTFRRARNGVVYPCVNEGLLSRLGKMGLVEFQAFKRSDEPGFDPKADFRAFVTAKGCVAVNLYRAVHSK